MRAIIRTAVTALVGTALVAAQSQPERVTSPCIITLCHTHSAPALETLAVIPTQLLHGVEVAFRTDMQMAVRFTDNKVKGVGIRFDHIPPGSSLMLDNVEIIPDREASVTRVAPAVMAGLTQTFAQSGHGVSGELLVRNSRIEAQIGIVLQFGVIGTVTVEGSVIKSMGFEGIYVWGVVDGSAQQADVASVTINASTIESTGAALKLAGKGRPSATAAIQYTRAVKGARVVVFGSKLLGKVTYGSGRSGLDVESITDGGRVDVRNSEVRAHRSGGCGLCVGHVVNGALDVSDSVLEGSSGLEIGSDLGAGGQLLANNTKFEAREFGLSLAANAGAATLMIFGSEFDIETSGSSSAAVYVHRSDGLEVAVVDTRVVAAQHCISIREQVGGVVVLNRSVVTINRFGIQLQKMSAGARAVIDHSAIYTAGSGTVPSAAMVLSDDAAGTVTSPVVLSIVDSEVIPSWPANPAPTVPPAIMQLGNVANVNASVDRTQVYPNVADASALSILLLEIPEGNNYATAGAGTVLALRDVTVRPLTAQTELSRDWTQPGGVPAGPTQAATATLPPPARVITHARGDWNVDASATVCVPSVLLGDAHVVYGDLTAPFDQPEHRDASPECAAFVPTPAPTPVPPTTAPTPAPTDAPTDAPTESPTEAPSVEPTSAPASTGGGAGGGGNTGSGTGGGGNGGSDNTGGGNGGGSGGGGGGNGNPGPTPVPVQATEAPTPAPPTAAPTPEPTGAAGTTWDGNGAPRGAKPEHAIVPIGLVIFAVLVVALVGLVIWRRRKARQGYNVHQNTFDDVA